MSSLFQLSLSLYIYGICFCSSALFGFHNLSPFSLFIGIFSVNLSSFIFVKVNHFICIIITYVFINLFYMSLCTCVLYWGFGQIYAVWCLVKTIPTIHGTIYLWNNVSISIYFLITCTFISSPTLIHLRCSGIFVIWLVCIVATLTCCAPGRLF